MKSILSALVLVILVWGCAKKIAPSNSGTASSAPATMPPANTGAGMEMNNATAAQPAQNTGTFGARVAPVEATGEAAAAIAGQKIYNVKCGRCHGLKPASDYTAAHWASILAVMAPRAELTSEEKENVYAYVKENAKK